MIKIEYIDDLSLEGLILLTDDVGMLQHSKFSIIDRRKGYTTDDNARALISALRYYQVYKTKESMELTKKYLTFLLSMQNEDGTLSNLLGYNRAKKDGIGSEESIGRALWACGTLLSSKMNTDIKKVAKEIFDKGLPSANDFTSPRARAYTILGLMGYHKEYPQDVNLIKNCKNHADFLINLYKYSSEKDWRWFEPYLTYANARLPQALFMAYNMKGSNHYLDTAIESLNFLIETQFRDGIFMPVGTKGWFIKGNEKATFDQQPIEASCNLEALIEAYNCSNKKSYLDYAVRCFNWYHGANIKKVKVFDPETSLCYDGITCKGLNKNLGAESTLSYYMSHLFLKMNMIF